METDQRRMVFLVRDTILNIKAVAAQVKYNQQRREKMVRVRVRALACTHARMYACMHTRIRACRATACKVQPFFLFIIRRKKSIAKTTH